MSQNISTPYTETKKVGVETSWERLCSYTPYIVLAYFALHFLTRIVLSTNLEVDEAQFVGDTGFQLLYGNSHPPLYNWLVRIVLELTNWHWHVAIPLLKAAILGSTYLLAFDLTKRLTKSNISATLAVISFLLMPQIIWQSQVTLAHTVLATFSTIATLHAITLVVQKNRLLSYLWLATALAIGTLAKFHFLIFVAAFIVAVCTIPSIRKLVHKGKALLAMLFFTALTAPSLIAAAQNLKQSTQRMNKLLNPETTTVWYDLPYIGVDGLLSLITAFAASMGLVLLIAIITYIHHRPSKLEKGNTLRQSCATLFWRSSAISLGIFALIVLFSDMHMVHERYITPFLIPLPFALILFWKMEDIPVATGRLMIFGAFMMLAALIGANGMFMYGKHALAYPYQQFAEGLKKQFGNDINIKTLRGRDFSNLVIYIKKKGQNRFIPDHKEVIAVWRSNSKTIPVTLRKKLGKQYRQASPVFSQTASYIFTSGPYVTMRAQRFIRK